jgi:hypothetical protein
MSLLGRPTEGRAEGVGGECLFFFLLFFVIVLLLTRMHGGKARSDCPSNIPATGSMTLESKLSVDQENGTQEQDERDGEKKKRRDETQFYCLRQDRASRQRQVRYKSGSGTSSRSCEISSRPYRVARENEDVEERDKAEENARA